MLISTHRSPTYRVKILRDCANNDHNRRNAIEGEDYRRSTLLSAPQQVEFITKREQVLVHEQR